MSELSFQIRADKMISEGGTVQVTLLPGWRVRVLAACEILFLGYFYGKLGKSISYETTVTLNGVEKVEPPR